MPANLSVHLYLPDADDCPEFLTVAGIIAAYLEEKILQIAAGVYAPRSYGRASHYLGVFAADRGALALADCHKSDLRKWLAAHPEWLATATRQDACGAVVTCFRWAEDELRIVNPFRRPSKVGPPVQPRPAISPAEYQAIRLVTRRAVTSRGRRARSREAFRVLLVFLWKTGCRTCEGRECRWDQLDWRRAVLDLTEHKTASATGENRLIPIRRLLPLLRWLLARRAPGQQNIFVNSLGKRWTCDRFAKEFRRFARAAGVREEVSAYCLRHGQLLGHTSLQSTQRYLHLAGKIPHLNAAMQQAVGGKRGGHGATNLFG